jgi:DNA-binding MarR family transcriptional regulator
MTDDVPWLSDREQRMWRRLAAMLTWAPTELDSQLQRDAGITHFEYWVLMALSEAPGRALRMSELAVFANGSQSRLSHVVAKLERNGWVRRERAAEDGRGNVAVLTDAGHDKIVESAPGHVRAVRSIIFDALTPEQVDQLEDIATAVMARVRARRPSAAPPR